jgi:TPR repeat protein
LRNGTIELKTAGLALFFACAALVPAPALASGLSIEDQCDAAAGSVHDQTRNTAFPPVEAAGMKLGVALSACRAAYNIGGGGARIAFQLARALERGGQTLSAEKLYGEAARHGHTAAMVSLGRLLQKKGDAEGAFALYSRAALAGDGLGAYALGMAYREGTGTAADAGLAARWLDVAAAGGYELASLPTGFPLETRLGEVR